ncbi:unnamed protein product [Rotaria socialis]|uniref:Uncharacterized protein n=1 Tax=Rotaria socialis TaxID=392032 RepID=A0A818EQV6_9BILA|nr:unnamed protein product [Rotaria socialis]CAF3462779.1 unnamed protein product [Rotaria socialis]CAF3561141.1 unnamed protein product [Rotaria socialis]CAF3770082.1 unnamed protein product [Rotaria socialis]CAF4396259.1 unnamed protein product [Rotaria socialis]
MESDLTKRRPSVIPGWSPVLPAGYIPAIPPVDDTASDTEQDAKNSSTSNRLSHLPSITSYETKPYLRIKKFHFNNQAAMSMAHTHGICVLNTDEEQIIACDHYNNRLLMFDSNTDGRLLEIFRGDMATPECVASRPHYQHQIYITKAHSISLYDLEKKQFIHQLGSEESGHANNRFNSPGGMSVDPANGEIYMCDTWNHRVCVFSPDFRYINRRWYLTQWQLEHHKVKPNFLAVNGTNECVVTCDDVPNYRGAVYVFDKMGYIQKIYDQETRKKAPHVEVKLNVPHGILLDDEGNWLTVCYSDLESCWVERRYKPYQHDEHELITYWRNKELKGPSALAIKRDQTLVVGDRDENAIYLFKQIQSH